MKLDIQVPVVDWLTSARMPDETDAKKDLNIFLLGELDETTRTPSYYMDEDSSRK